MPLPHPGPGRYPLWSDADAMLAAGLEYFQEKDAQGKRYTVAGLALHLNMGYQTLLEYGRNPRFSETVRMLKSRILEQAENALYDKDTAGGAKFHAQNLGMSEKVETLSQNTNLNVNAAVALEHLSDEQLSRIEAAIKLVTDPGADRSGALASPEKQDSVALPGSGAVET